MSGLDNLFATYGPEYGALGAMQAGQRRGLADMATQLSNERSAAETARYTAQTPDSNRVLAAQATSGELGNLQGQADQAAGVHGANAQKTVAQARLEAEKAKAAFDQLPLEIQTKFHTGVQTKTRAMLDSLEQVLTTTGDLNKAIEYIETHHPTATEDKGWIQAKQQYANKRPQQVLQELRAAKAKLASSDAYGNSEFQGKMIQQDALLASQERQQTIQAGATVGAARERAAVGEAKITSASLLNNWIEAWRKAPEGSPEKEEARLIINALRSGSTTTEETLLGPQVKVKDALPGKAAGGAGDIKAMVEASGAKYDPANFDYRINPENGKVQSKPKGN